MGQGLGFRVWARALDVDTDTFSAFLYSYSSYRSPQPSLKPGATELKRSATDALDPKREPRIHHLSNTF